MTPDAHETLLAMLRRHEGFRSAAYEDHLGYLTIGYGRLIDARRGGGITRDEGEYLLANDVDERLDDLAERAPWWVELDDARQVALADMAFQLGVDGLLAFERMIAAIQGGDWNRAHREALNSRWAQQTPERASEIAHVILTGRLD